jgi:hypothetical protein
MCKLDFSCSIFHSSLTWHELVKNKLKMAFKTMLFRKIGFLMFSSSPMCQFQRVNMLYVRISEYLMVKDIAS